MYRLTGKEAFGLMEAYQAVYQPELREEQIWEGVENWVHSLLEEGYDLSDYTWEEMYESYRGTSVAGQAPTETDAIEPKFGVDKTGIKPLTTFTKPAALTPMDQWAKANPRLAAAQAEKDRIRGTSQTDNPLMKDMRDRMPMTPSVQSPTLAKDLGGGSGNQSLLNNPNANKSPEISAPNPVKANVPGFALGGKDPRVSTPATPKPTTVPAPMDAFTAGGGAAKMTKSGMTRDQVIAQGNKNNARLSQDKLTPRGVQLTHIDLFDLVKGHLLDEGYADTEEAALAIMGNMSEEWKLSIVEADSLADMAARRAARLRRQAKREGVRSNGKPFGNDYSEPITDYAAADAKWARPNAPKPKT